MKLLLYKVCLYVISFFLLSIIVLIAASAFTYKKLAEKGRAVVIDKNKRLDSLPSPKIILVGGSNVSYGINSKIIEDSLKMPVADMSINANMGMMFYYNQIRNSLKKGDIVIGIPEYIAYHGDNMLGNSGTYALGIIEKKNFSYLNTIQLLRFPLYIGDLIKDCYSVFCSQGKNKESKGRFLYNECGDYTGHKNDTSKNNSFRYQKMYDFNSTDNDIDQDFIKLINSFSDYAASKGSIYLHAWPVYAKSFFSSTYANQIHKALPGINWIGTPSEYLYNFEDLYDSPNHLVYNKIEDRTLKLIKDIRLKLNK